MKPPRFCCVASALIPAIITVTGCRPPVWLRIGEPSFSGGNACFGIQLGSAFEEGSLEVSLGGTRVVDKDVTPVAIGVSVCVPAASGEHGLEVRARFAVARADVKRRAKRVFESPPGAPDLVGSMPEHGGSRVARSE